MTHPNRYYDLSSSEYIWYPTKRFLILIDNDLSMIDFFESTTFLIKGRIRELPFRDTKFIDEDLDKSQSRDLEDVDLHWPDGARAFCMRRRFRSWNVYNSRERIACTVVSGAGASDYDDEQRPLTLTKGHFRNG